MVTKVLSNDGDIAVVEVDGKKLYVRRDDPLADEQPTREQFCLDFVVGLPVNPELKIKPLRVN